VEYYQLLKGHKSTQLKLLFKILTKFKLQPHQIKSGMNQLLHTAKNGFNPCSIYWKWVTMQRHIPVKESGMNNLWETYAVSEGGTKL
jgi:hypothetical protein